MAPMTKRAAAAAAAAAAAQSSSSSFALQEQQQQEMAARLFLSSLHPRVNELMGSLQEISSRLQQQQQQQQQSSQTRLAPQETFTQAHECLRQYQRDLQIHLPRFLDRIMALAQHPNQQRPPRKHDTSEDNNIHSQEQAEQQDLPAMIFSYCLQPLLVTFKILSTTTTSHSSDSGRNPQDEAVHNDNDNNYVEISFIDAARRRKLFQTTAETLQYLIAQYYSNHYKYHNDGRLFDGCGFTISQRVQMVELLVLCFPVISKSNSRSSSSGASSSSLDGDSTVCLQLYLELLQDYVWNNRPSIGGSASSSPQLSQAIMTHWSPPEGALVARVVETCLDCLVMVGDDKKNKKISGISHLALKCLITWMQQNQSYKGNAKSGQIDGSNDNINNNNEGSMSPSTLPLVSFSWQRFFPGIFHALYPRISRVLQRGDDNNMAHLGLVALVTLCRSVVDMDDDFTNNDNNNRGIHVAKAGANQNLSETTAAAKRGASNNNSNKSWGLLADQLQAWKDLADGDKLLQANRPKTKPSSSQEDNQKERDAGNSLFWTRVCQNLAFPLQRLLLQCSRYPSPKIRQAGLQLARVLICHWWTALTNTSGRPCSLVDDQDNSILARQSPQIQELWTKLEESILDMTVQLSSSGQSMQEKENDASIGDVAERQVSTEAHDLLQQYAGDRLPNSARILGRVESLWEDLTALTSGQQWAEWSNQLQLLQGYIIHLDRRDLYNFIKIDEDYSDKSSRVTRLWFLLWTVDLHLLQTQWQDGTSLTNGRPGLALPWKYLNHDRLDRIQAFVKYLGHRLGARSAAVVVDDLVSRCCGQHNLINSPKKADSGTRLESVTLLQVSGILLSTIDSSTKKGARTLEMLTKSTLPIVLSALGEQDSVKDCGSPHDAKISACLVTTLLQWLSFFFASVAKPQRSSVIPTCLFPVLKCFVCTDWIIVKQSAKATLRSLWIDDNVAFSTERLVQEYSESLLATILARLRTCHGSRELNQTLRTASTILHLGRHAFGNKTLKVITAQTQEILRVSVDRFDRWAVHAGNDVEMCLVYEDFFDAAVLCLYAAIECEKENSTTAGSGSACEDDDDKWLALLDEFRTSGKSNTSTYEKNDNDVGGGVGKQEGTILVKKDDTDLVARVVSIGSYLLSHSSLRVQSKACNTMRSCFGYLHRISKLPQAANTEEELNGAKNAILRHIADCWPSLAARAKSTINTLRSNNASTSMLILPHTASNGPSAPVQNHGQLRLFVSRVFDLLGTMVEASDDFMASRIREAVWPWIDQVVSDAVKRLVGSGEKDTMSQRVLLESAVTCVDRIYRHRPTGVPLSGLVPVVGSRLLLLLDNSGTIVNLVVSTIKGLVLVDSDALVRPLHKLANVPLPVSPFFQPGGSHESASTCGTPSEKRAQSLLHFIDDLPEQTIE